jgi:hypothetical protein
VESITNRLVEAEERISGIEDRLRNYFIQSSIKEKQS